jgi:predicted ATP-dependent endonuclease of OLD family
MYLSEVQIEGYKIFNEKFAVKLNKGLTVIVGENGTGKSAIIDSIRVLLSEDEFGWIGIGESDFHRDIKKQSTEKGADRILIKGIFSSLNDTEQVAYLPWLDYTDNSKATLNVAIDNKEDSFGKFKWKKWGNETVSGIFEAELVDAIRCIYLPPLRNAPEKLQAYRGSRLARLIRNLTKNEDQKQKHELEEKANKFNKELLKDKDIQLIDKLIKEKIVDTIGSVFGQDSMIQFSEVNFNRIIERLKLLFYPSILDEDVPDKDKMYRELDENSLVSYL